MTHSYHIPVFAKNLADYLQNNLIGKMHTDIKTSKDSLSVKIYLHDPSFNDDLEVGEYISYFVDNKKVKQEFKGHPFLMDGIHLLYENGERKDLHQDIPFP